MKRKYVLSYDEYMGLQPSMSDFEGTWRELLYHVLNVNDDMGEDDEDGWDLPSGRHVKTVKEMTEDELVKWFDSANGDGQQYVMVWDVAAGKKVLG